MENSMEVFQRVKVKLPYDPAIPFLGIYPKEVKAGKRYLHTNVHSNTFHNSQEMEATELSIYGWMDKENVANTYKDE